MDSVQKNYLRVSRNCFSDTSGNDINERHGVLENNGLDILHEHKVCIVIVIGGEKSSHCSLQISEFLCNQGGFMKVDGLRFSTPLLIVCSENELQFYQEQFSNHDYFGFDKEKVLFFEEEKLPVLKNSPDDQNTHRMLLSSPWEILQSPVGSGGVLSLLSSRSLLDDFSKWGIEYIQICSFTERIAIGHLAFLGLTCSKAMDVGVKIFDDVHERNEFDLILSMKRLRKISKQADKIRFESVHEQNEHVELVDKEWIDANPSMPNSICFRSSIYNTLDASHADTTCILHITDRL